jgi:hypothetical protein
MTDETTPTPTPETKAKKSRQDQDQAQADQITAALQTLTTAQSDPEVSKLLASRGYDATKLAEGLAVQRAAQTAFSARQQAIGAQKQATAQLGSAQAAAQQVLTDFRETARSILKDDAARAALSLGTKVPTDLQKFITMARASFEAAVQNPAYLAELAKYGFPQANLQSAVALMDALASAGSAQEQAKAGAVRATQERDAACKELKAWMTQFRVIAKVATRSRPDMLKKIGF